MKINRYLFALFLMLCMTAASGGQAAKINPTAAEKEKTKMLSVQIESKQPDLAGSGEYMQMKADEIMDIVKEAGLNYIVHESTNYGAYPAPNRSGCGNTESCFQVMGNISFTFMPDKQEKQVLDLLQKKGFSATIGQYYFGSCGDRTNRSRSKQ